MTNITITVRTQDGIELRTITMFGITVDSNTYLTLAEVFTLKDNGIVVTEEK